MVTYPQVIINLFPGNYGNLPQCIISLFPGNYGNRPPAYYQSIPR